MHGDAELQLNGIIFGGIGEYINFFHKKRKMVDVGQKFVYISFVTEL